MANSADSSSSPGDKPPGSVLLLPLLLLAGAGVGSGLAGTRGMAIGGIAALLAIACIALVEARKTRGRSTLTRVLAVAALAASLGVLWLAGEEAPEAVKRTNTPVHRVAGVSSGGAPGTLTVKAGRQLANADLEGADLRSAVLPGAVLTYANLREARAGGVVLTGADLVGADLSRANLSGATLVGADLRGAALQDACLAGANLRGANLSGARLSGARLEGASLIAVISNSQTQWPTDQEAKARPASCLR